MITSAFLLCTSNLFSFCSVAASVCILLLYYDNSRHNIVNHAADSIFLSKNYFHVLPMITYFLYFSVQKSSHNMAVSYIHLL